MSNIALFAEAILREMPHTPSDDQAKAAARIAEFLADPRTEQAFILRGYAGTGKTTLVSAVVRVWQKLDRPVVLLAPTGRAAKVLGQHAGIPAFTVHRIIYRQETFKGEDTHFGRGWNGAKEALFVIDEASMLNTHDANVMETTAQFGDGNVLEDLSRFVTSGTNCRMMMVGDTAQLPPVGFNDSPALRPSVLQMYGFQVRGAQLNQVVRQQHLSPVLREATRLREFLAKAQKEGMDGFPSITPTDPELHILPGDEFLEALETSYRQWGEDETIVVTRSNLRANAYNNGIRARIFDRESALTRGDRVMIVRNNYHWTAQAQAELPRGQQLPMAFIANGDTAEIIAYSNVHEQFGFTFADVTLCFHDYDDFEIDCRVILDTLQSVSPSLTADEQRRLFNAVAEDYEDIKQQRQRMQAIRRDPYYNALQLKYAYAVTCHKAQGGQWHEVYVDQGVIPADMDGISYLRWLYTAFTRTSDILYLVNWPKEQTNESLQ